jgi:putative endonuclease
VCHVRDVEVAGSNPVIPTAPAEASSRSEGGLRFRSVSFEGGFGRRASSGAARLVLIISCRLKQLSRMWIVYILKCSDGKFYTGCTSDLENRIKRHQGGQVPATQNRLPIALVTYIVFSEKQKAYDFEKYLKTGSGRAVMIKRLV